VKSLAIQVGLVILVCMSNFACGGGNLGGSNNGSAQIWSLDFGPDPVVAGREEIALVSIAPFTNSGTFTETSNSPGVLFYNNDGSCSYRLTIGGTIAHAGQNDTWVFQGVTGSGCGMQSLGSGGGSSVGAYPTSTTAAGTINVTTQSSLPTVTQSAQWQGTRVQ
jgi:hypothetical protein